MTHPQTAFNPDADADDEEVSSADLDFNFANISTNFPGMADVAGCLLLAQPSRRGTRPSKQAGQDPYPYVEADVWVLELPAGGWPTPRYAANSVPFKIERFNFVGKAVADVMGDVLDRGRVSLCTVVRGQPQGGNNAPWLLVNATAEQETKARIFWARQRKRDAIAATKAAAALARDVADGSIDPFK